MEVINRNEVAAFITKDTSEVREILAPRNSSLKNQSLAEATVAAGKATETHYHSQSEEIYYILQGRGKMTIEGETREIKEGDGVAILPGRRHTIANIGDENLVFLCCCAPAYTHEGTALVS